MQPEYEGTPAGEKKPIKSSSQLAETLGFSRDPSEPLTSNRRTYEKAIENPLGKGVFSLVVVDDKGSQAEQIYLDVEVSKSSVWARHYNLTADEFLRDQMGLMSPIIRFPKKVLINGGYGILAEYIKRLEAEGKFQTDLSELYKAKETARVIAGVVLPVIQSEFPKLNQVDDVLDSSREIRIFATPTKGKRSAFALNIEPSPDRITVNIGKLKFDPVSGQPVDLKLDWIAGGQQFPYGNQEEAEKAAQMVVADILSNMKQSPDRRVPWRDKSSDFDSILRKLGFKENGELAYLRQKVLYNLLKNQPSALEGYDEAAKTALASLPEGSRKRAEIGFLVARARIFHLAGSAESTVKMQEAINDALSQGLPNLAKILSEIDKEEFVHWDDLEK